MKYSFVIRKNGNKHIIDLKSLGIKSINMSPDEMIYIDKFTYKFNTNTELFNYLLENNLVLEKYRDGQFDILKIKTNGEEPLYSGIHLKTDDELLLKQDTVINPDFIEQLNDSDISFNPVFLRFYYRLNIDNKELMKMFRSEIYYPYKGVPEYAQELAFFNHYYHEGHTYEDKLTEQNMMSSLVSKMADDYASFRKLAMLRIKFERKQPYYFLDKSDDNKEEIEHYKEILEGEKLNYESEISDIEEIDVYLNHIHNHDNSSRSQK